MINFKEKLTGIKAFIFDIDGVLSQQTISLNDFGVPHRTVNLRDGYALRYALKKGYCVGIISGGDAMDYVKRLNHLGVSDIYMKCEIKIDYLKAFMEKYNLNRSEVLFMGDDIPDLPVMQAVGAPVCPSDADSEVKKAAIYISDRKGGEGCARDVVEQVMRLHNKWLDSDAYGW
ncbi:MAG: HAD hydrolase family protein [Bacteroidales bacterium]|jgi:3-deoxy-D-manno-octulosonate 8-phosphate phosphatase (KDO 8-P phosphatase)|nr:HAD hydrolase family protein [Bacteroidales bacterium]